MSSTPSTGTPQPDKPKTRWDSILTSTPVVLTVVATLLAGLSSSEMSRAQYFRALAAQHQSKVGDQWSFFQAKRTRGGNTEMAIELLRAQHALVPVTPDMIAEHAAELPHDLERMARVGERLLRALAAAKADTGRDSPRPAVERLVQASRRSAEESRILEKRIAEMLARPEISEALGYLNTPKLPEVTRQPIGDDSLRQAHEAIAARKTENETASLMSSINEEHLRQALDTAEANAQAFEEKSKPVDKGLAAVGQLIQEEAALTAKVHRLADRATLALPEMAAKTQEIQGFRPPSPPGKRTSNDSDNEVWAAAAALAQADAALVKSTDELNQSFLAARRDYTARRYEREARDNQEIAGVLEIQVRKSSWESERHRNRSMLFFIGMLVAQAGVTAATFSLAMRQRNVLWVLATIAGLAAIAFSGYVYLFT